MQLNLLELRITVNGKPITEYFHRGQTFIEGRNRSNYEIEFRNHNSFRVEAIISVDGLSVIDGKSAGEKSTGYVVEANSSISIPGWKLDNTQVAAFAFAAKQASYVVQSTGSSANVGVIGVMAFREKVQTPSYTTNSYWNDRAKLGGGCGFSDLSYGSLRGASRGICSNTASGAVTYNSALPVEDSLGTAFGDAKDFKTSTTTFQRADLQAVMVINYDSAANLKVRGIDTSRKAQKISTGPQAFPASSDGCVPPHGWGSKAADCIKNLSDGITGYRSAITEERKKQVWVNERKKYLVAPNITEHLNGQPNGEGTASLSTLLDNIADNIAADSQINFSNDLFLTRDTFSKLNLREFVGVQPLKSVVGAIHDLHVSIMGSNGDETLQIIKRVVEAEAHRLAAKREYSNLSADALDMLSTELATEIDGDVFQKLRTIAGDPAVVFDHGYLAATMKNVRFVGDIHNEFGKYITQQATTIFNETHRYPGNRVVLGVTPLVILQSASESQMVRQTRQPYANYGSFFAGTFSQVGSDIDIDVYVDKNLGDDAPALLAYKGSEADAGAYWAPYVLASTFGNKDSHNGLQNFMTRYGWYDNEASRSYYKTIGVNAETLSFI